MAGAACWPVLAGRASDCSRGLGVAQVALRRHELQLTAAGPALARQLPGPARRMAPAGCPAASAPAATASRRCPSPGRVCAAVRALSRSRRSLSSLALARGHEHVPRQRRNAQTTGTSPQWRQHLGKRHKALIGRVIPLALDASTCQTAPASCVELMAAPQPPQRPPKLDWRTV